MGRLVSAVWPFFYFFFGFLVMLEATVIVIIGVCRWFLWLWVWVGGLCGFQLGCGGLFLLIGLFFGVFFTGFFFFFVGCLCRSCCRVGGWRRQSCCSRWGIDLDKWVLIHFLFFVWLVGFGIPYGWDDDGGCWMMVAMWFVLGLWERWQC